MFNFDQDSFYTYTDRIPRDQNGYTKEVSFENLNILPNIKAQMIERDKVKYFQDKGIKISSNESCIQCGIFFDPQDL
jgi:hypothetical protein